jgi:hypothetical protein
MPRRLVSCQRGIAEFHLVTIVEHPVHMGRSDTASLSIVDRTGSRSCRRIRRHPTSASMTLYSAPVSFFHLGAASVVVEVSMADQQDLYVAETKPQLFDALPNERDRGSQIAVDQNVSGGRRNQVRGQPPAAHIIDVADHAMRGKRLTPFRGTGRRGGGSSRSKSRLHATGKS